MMKRRLPGLALVAAIVGLLVGPWMVQAQNPAQRVIIMDSTGTHAAGVSSGGAVSTSASVSVDAISHISSVTHVVGNIVLRNVAGTAVTVTGTSLDVNCTGCAAASVVNVGHISGALHIAGTINGAQFHIQGLGIPGQAHGGVLTIQGVAGGVAVPVSGSLSVTTDNINVFHQSTIRHISSAVHVAAIAQPVHVVGVSVVNAANPLTCHSSMAFHTSARATTIAHANSGMKIYICGLLVLSQAADNVSVVEGQGTDCATGRQELIGHTTAALSLPATGGFSAVQPFPWINSKTTGNAVCLIKGNATQHVSGVIMYRGSD